MSPAMATVPESDHDLFVVEQLARIRKMMIESDRVQQEIKLATPAMYFQGMLAAAALTGAGAALAKIFS